MTWLDGDACELDTLAAAEVERADVVAAVTGDDEDNLVVSLLAKQEFGVPRVVARVNNPKNEWMFNELWGVDVAVSTPHLITALVEEAVSVGSFVRLLSFEGGKARLAEVRLAEGSPADGKEIVELGVPARRHRRRRAARRAADRPPRRHRAARRRRGRRAGDRRVRGGRPRPPRRPVELSEPDLRHEGVRRVVDHGAVAEVDGDALEHDRPAVLDAGDAAPPGEHRGDRAGAVADHHLEVRHAVARGDDHPLDLAADAHRARGGAARRSA